MGNWELIKEVTLTDDANSIVITTDKNGQPFKATSYAVAVSAQPSSSTTSNTNAYVRVEPYSYVATIQAVVRTYETTFASACDVIAVPRDNTECLLARAISTSGTGMTYNAKALPSDYKAYSEYFELYTTGTAKFGAGTVITLFAIRAK